MHPQIAARIVRAAGISEGETVLEVGPGRGILTAALLASGAKVVAVEADDALLAGLHERFADEEAAGRLELLHADVREYLSERPQAPANSYAVVANIPYYLTGELIRLFLTRARQPRCMTLLLQKEVAERIARDPKESLLSLSVKAFGEPVYEFTVPKGAFTPPPKVDSAVLSVRGISRARFSSVDEERRFFELIRAGFAHKRKRLAKNLVDAGFSADVLQQDARLARVRAEDMPLSAWLSFVGLMHR